MQRALATGSILAALSLLASCAPEPAAPTKTVVWVVIDTLRADALGAYGFDERGEGGTDVSPNFDALAAEGLLFERAYASAPWTIPSVVTQLSGRWPFDHGQTRMLEPLAPDVLMLPEVLRAEGWRTAGVTTNFLTRAAHGFDRGFERFDDGLAKGHEGSFGDLAVQRLLALGDELGGRDASGLFLYALLFEPHYRYEEQPGLRFGPGFGSREREVYGGPLAGDESLADLRTGLREGRIAARDLAFLRGRYQGEVARVDRALGRLREGLVARGLWEEALVIVTADHGELIGERGWIGHTIELSDDLVRVPLVVKPPASMGVAPRRVPEAFGQVDLFATVLDAAGLELEGFEGIASRSQLESWRTGAAPSRRYHFVHTDFQPLLEGGAGKRTLRFGVVDGERQVRWEVDHLATDGDGNSAPLGRLVDLVESERVLAEGAEPPAEHAGLVRLRGLLAEPLEGADPAERLIEGDPR